MDFGSTVDGPSAEEIAAREQRARQEGGSAAVQAHQARMDKIMGSDKVKGKESYAYKIAGKYPQMSAEDILELVENYNPAGTQQRQEQQQLSEADIARLALEARARASGVQDVSAQNQPSAKEQIVTRDEKVSANWDKLAEKTNARFGGRR